ncbi:TPA: hypothetical protein JG914_004690 [Enterobacter hormaechei subsp. steigerwaltii]|nr:hypothetical protein [Enterobacter hormaechei subsp. steigerwaltii]
MKKENKADKKAFDPKAFLGMEIISDKEKKQVTGGERGRKRNCSRCH